MTVPQRLYKPFTFLHLFPQPPPKHFEVIRRPSSHLPFISTEIPLQLFTIDSRQRSRTPILPIASEVPTRLRHPYDAYPPSFIPTRRWWIHTAFRVAILTLNAFLGHLYPFLVQYFKADIVGAVNMGVEQWAQLDTYWTKIVYGVVAIPLAWLADHPSIRRDILGTVCAIAGLSVVSLAFAPKSGLLLLCRMVFGIGQAVAGILSVSLVSDLLPWPEVFIGMSWFYLSRYLGYALNGALVKLLHTGKLGGWKYIFSGTGTIGIGVAIFIIFVVREPKRQTTLAASSNNPLFPMKPPTTSPESRSASRQ
jgi:MFS family permease